MSVSNQSDERNVNESSPAQTQGHDEGCQKPNQERSLQDVLLQAHRVLSAMTPTEAAGVAAALFVSMLVVSGFRVELVMSFISRWIVWPLYHLVLRVVGTAIGFGFGLGLATNVYDQLEAWKLAEERAREESTEKGDGIVSLTTTVVANNSAMGASARSRSFKVNNTSHSSMSSLRSFSSSGALYIDDEQTYASLMRTAGYSAYCTPHNYNHQHQQLYLRGQVVRIGDPNYELFFRHRMYNFSQARFSDEDDEFDNDYGKSDNGISKKEQDDERKRKQALQLPLSKAVATMYDIWPTLPPCINQELGRTIEYIVRDFVASWYSKVDYGCIYEDPELLLQRNIQQQNHDIRTNISAIGDEDGSTSNQCSYHSQNQHPKRMMLYGVGQYRPIPFLDSLYESMSVIFGNLATRVENVNVFELVLLKWIQVLSHTFKVYRMLRKNVIKQPTLAASITTSATTTTGTKNKQQQFTESQRISESSSSPEKGYANTVENATGMNRVTKSIRNSFSLRSASNLKGITDIGTSGESASGSASGSTNGNTNSLDVVPDNTKKQQQNMPYQPISEMAMTKEFLFAGKLHKAVTFGLDVPSLLFSDASGRECGIPPPLLTNTSTNHDENDTSNLNDARASLTDDEVLERRLFETPLLRECETDYNRVLGHRIVRTLIPRSDYTSGIVRTILTEMMGGCVLTPIMGLFCPESINSWIIAGLAAPPPPSEESTTSNSDTPDAKKDDPTNTPTTTVSTTNITTTTTVEPTSSVISTAGYLNESVETSEADDGDEVELIISSQESTTDSNGTKKQQQNDLTKDDGTKVAAEAINEDKKEHNAYTASDPNNKIANQLMIATASVATTTSSSTSFHNEDVSCPTDNLAATHNNIEQSNISANSESVSSLDAIYMQLTMALIDLEHFVDFDEYRNARMNNTQFFVDWDNPECRMTVVRLVLVVEAALSHGRCTYKRRPTNSDDDSEDGGTDDFQNPEMDDSRISNPVNEQQTAKPPGSSISDEQMLLEHESVSFSQILMELTSDIDAFEQRLDAQLSPELVQTYSRLYNGMIAEKYQPSAQEQSTMRTLIAAWLHTGQIYRAISLLIKANETVLAPYYHKNAFLRTPESSSAFARQLIPLVDISILVDTMAVLACPRLEETDHTSLALLMNRSGTGTVNNPSDSCSVPVISTSPTGPQTGDGGRSPTSALNSALMASTAQMSSSSVTPRYLDFNRNESFAASLRSERERRMASWDRIMHNEICGPIGYNEGLQIVCRTYRRRGRNSPVSDEDDVAMHKELHHVARIFYSGTNTLTIRDAARRQTSNSVDNEQQSMVGGDSSLQEVSLITVETSSPRRRLEIPDDDSSFLLRAQPRPLNAVGVHRDQRNHDQSFKCFAATFEEPTLPASPGHYTGGRYVRRCLVRYFPLDRTASVSIQSEAVRKLDQRKITNSVPDTITVGQSTMLSSGRNTPFLSAEFMRDRHLCQRVVQKGSTRTQSILASNVMEPTDFTSIPRSGKAIDFVYRMNLYERPMLDLSGKYFLVHDSASLGAHRADASALELSDATISIALLALGSTTECYNSNMTSSLGFGESGTSPHPPKPIIEMGKDGYPVLWMKFTRKQDDTHVEVKPYRTSFVRAALLITTARHEAQLQCLIKCVKDGSAKHASKALTEACLKRAIKLLEFASSRNREKQSLIQRDLKFGVNHIDQGQLRRNGLLLPRYPTELLDLEASVEDILQPTEAKGVNNIFGAASPMYKIRCVATVTLVASDEELEGDDCYRCSDGTLGKTFREEWTIYRTMKEFQSLHKQLKGEVSTAESSGSAGSRLVGAAAAAFAATNPVPGRQRQKKMLIPSLSQATKAGALGGTKKLNAKRKEILDTYLSYLLSPGHLIGRSSELLLFLGAFYPLPQSVKIGISVNSDSDPLGRTEMLRTIVQRRVAELKIEQVPHHIISVSPAKDLRGRGNSAQSISETPNDEEIIEDIDEQEEKGAQKIDMIPSIKSKIDKVQLAQVRNQLFELLRYQFGFENASFIRNRMLQALKTASFAVTSPSEFRRILYKLHLDHVNPEALAGWIKMLSDILWPNGVFFSSSPPTTPEEIRNQANKAKDLLHSSFPGEVKAILGQDLTRDGLDIFHEMLQNRMVLKSMAYMLFDLLWLEIFPEIGDFLTCGAALDIDPKPNV